MATKAARRAEKRPAADLDRDGGASGWGEAGSKPSTAL